MMVCSSNSRMPANARATMISDFPFCLGADTAICRAAHVPSVRSPIAA
jgi:hypothetical protein